jgi:S-DNA-T family DNA segregation ATPase FtsK/SpoIIIE
VRLSLPAPADPVPPPPFPLLGVLAPLLAAGVIWAVTRSPFALVFAVLSPVVAVASVIDARLQTRRRGRTAAAAERVALAELATTIGEHLWEERERRLEGAPTAGALVAGSAPGAALWRTAGKGSRPLVLGLGRQPSGVVLDGRPASPRAKALVERASRLEAVPVLADALGGIGVCGPPPLARALLRGLVLQFLFAAPPGTAAVRRRPEAGWEWLDGAPHPNGDPGPAPAGTDAPEARESLLLADGELTVLLASAAVASELPAGCATVLAITGAASARIITGSRSAADGDAIVPDLIAAPEAAAVARALAAHPRATGNGSGGVALPDVVPLLELLLPVGEPAAADLRAPGGRAEAGERRTDRLAAGLGVVEGGAALVVDLVADGPHAVVGGTTGSGKSELLVSWVCALAATHEPAEVTFLLVDFKGGSAFDPLAALPHCVGLLTDLGPREAQRALASLRAEVRHRERMLREQGARDLASCPAGSGPPRLVIVVDEFAAMLTDLPDLHDVFVDLAARGRSLGVHLILCTQRPSGSVRDALLANCNLRLSLRVNSRADSTTILGTDAASVLPASPAGRCLVRVGGSEPRLCQVATVGDGVTALVNGIVGRGRERAWAPQRRPWLEPLPAILTAPQLEDPAVQRGDLAGAIVFGLLDVPEEQARRYAAWNPAEDGPLLVLGGARSGKSSVVSALSRASGPGRPARILPPDPAGAWDEIGAALEAVRSGGAGASGATGTGGGSRILLAVDDVDVLLGRVDAEYAAELVDRLAALLREGAAAGFGLVLTAQRLSGAIAPLAGHAGRTLLLRLAGRQEHVLAGGEAALFDPDLAPGGGWWQGHRLQVALVPPVPPPAPRPPRPVRLRPGRGYAVVSTRPAEAARRLRAAAGGRPLTISLLADDAGPGAAERTPTDGEATGVGTGAEAISVLLGDPEEWQGQWGALQAARRSRCVLFDGCTPRDVRALARIPGLPPPLADARSVWFVEPGGEVQRRSWPA